MSEIPPTPCADWSRRARRMPCRHHGMAADFYVPQLLRLVQGAPRERKIYYSMVDDVVGAHSPLGLFKESDRRPGICFIESLYRAHRLQVDSGDVMMEPSLAPLGYARWVAWRQFGAAVRSGSVRFSDGVERYINRSHHAVRQQVHNGWWPEADPDDPELLALRQPG